MKNSFRLSLKESASWGVNSPVAPGSLCRWLLSRVQDTSSPPSPGKFCCNFAGALPTYPTRMAGRGHTGHRLSNLHPLAPGTPELDNLDTALSARNCMGLSFCAVQYSTMQCSSVQCSAVYGVQSNHMECNSLICSAIVICSAVRSHVVECSHVECNSYLPAVSSLTSQDMEDSGSWRSWSQPSARSHSRVSATVEGGVPRCTSRRIRKSKSEQAGYKLN